MLLHGGTKLAALLLRSARQARLHIRLLSGLRSITPARC
jgi:hypothetical protein